MYTYVCTCSFYSLSIFPRLSFPADRYTYTFVISIETSRPDLRFSSNKKKQFSAPFFSRQDKGAEETSARTYDQQPSPFPEPPPPAPASEPTAQALVYNTVFSRQATGNVSGGFFTSNSGQKLCDRRTLSRGRRAPLRNPRRSRSPRGTDLSPLSPESYLSTDHHLVIGLEEGPETPDERDPPQPACSHLVYSTAVARRNDQAGSIGVHTLCGLYTEVLTGSFGTTVPSLPRGGGS